MKKIVSIFLCFLFVISGCTSSELNKKQMKVYNGFKDSLLTNKDLISKNIPFEYNIEIKQINDKYKYTVSIYKPIVAMNNVQMLIFNPADKNEDYLSDSIGIFSDTPYNMVPNQSNPADGYVKKIQLEGVSKSPDFKIYALVAYRDKNELIQYQSYFSFNIIDGQNVKMTDSNV